MEIKINKEKIVKVGNKYYILPQNDCKSMFAMNETCKIVIDMIDEDKSVDYIADHICKEYNADREVVLQDVLNLIQSFREAGVII